MSSTNTHLTRNSLASSSAFVLDKQPQSPSNNNAFASQTVTDTESLALTILNQQEKVTGEDKAIITESSWHQLLINCEHPSFLELMKSVPFLRHYLDKFTSLNIDPPTEWTTKLETYFSHYKHPLVIPHKLTLQIHEHLTLLFLKNSLYKDAFFSLFFEAQGYPCQLSKDPSIELFLEECSSNEKEDKRIELEEPFNLDNYIKWIKEEIKEDSINPKLNQQEFHKFTVKRLVYLITAHQFKEVLDILSKHSITEPILKLVLEMIKNAKKSNKHLANNNIWLSLSTFYLYVTYLQLESCKENPLKKLILIMKEISSHYPSNDLSITQEKIRTLIFNAILMMYREPNIFKSDFIPVMIDVLSSNSCKAKIDLSLLLEFGENLAIKAMRNANINTVIKDTLYDIILYKEIFSMNEASKITVNTSPILKNEEGINVSLQILQDFLISLDPSKQQKIKKQITDTLPAIITAIEFSYKNCPGVDSCIRGLKNWQSKNKSQKTALSIPTPKKTTAKANKPKSTTSNNSQNNQKKLVMPQVSPNEITNSLTPLSEEIDYNKKPLNELIDLLDKTDENGPFNWSKVGTAIRNKLTFSGDGQVKQLEIVDLLLSKNNYSAALLLEAFQFVKAIKTNDDLKMLHLQSWLNLWKSYYRTHKEEDMELFHNTYLAAKNCNSTLVKNKYYSQLDEIEAILVKQQNKNNKKTKTKSINDNNDIETSKEKTKKVTLSQEMRESLELLKNEQNTRKFISLLKSHFKMTEGKHGKHPIYELKLSSEKEAIRIPVPFHPTVGVVIGTRRSIAFEIEYALKKELKKNSDFTLEALAKAVK